MITDALPADVGHLPIAATMAWAAAEFTVPMTSEPATKPRGELVELPYHAEDRDHIYHLFVVRTPHRDRLVETLRERGVGAAIYYGSPLHLQPVFTSLGYGPGDMPVTEAMGHEGVALPMFPTMTREQVDEVVEAVRAAVPTPVA